MSTVALTHSVPLPVDPAWVPSSLYRVTLEQYEAMVEAGIFTGRERVHLINGFLVAKMTQMTPIDGGYPLWRRAQPRHSARLACPASQAHPDPQPGSR